MIYKDWKYNNLIEQLKNRFLELERLIENEATDYEIMTTSYKIIDFIESNEIAPEEELKVLEEVGANHPMSMLVDWYEDTQYRLNRKEVV